MQLARAPGTPRQLLLTPRRSPSSDLTDTDATSSSISNPQAAAEVQNTAEDDDWKKMMTFSSNDDIKHLRKLRQIIQHQYSKTVHFGLAELRDVLVADPFCAVINAGTVQVHKGGALYCYLSDIARLHDRTLSGHGNSNTLNLLRPSRDEELMGRRKSLQPGIDIMIGASKYQEPNIFEQLREFYTCTQRIQQLDLSSTTR